jgi:hypothetical protein
MCARNADALTKFRLASDATDRRTVKVTLVFSNRYAALAGSHGPAVFWLKLTLNAAAL